MSVPTSTKTRLITVTEITRLILTETVVVYCENRTLHYAPKYIMQVPTSQEPHRTSVIVNVCGTVSVYSNT
jgi:hypothetical protein